MAVLIKTEEARRRCPYRKGFGCADVRQVLFPALRFSLQLQFSRSACEKCRGFGRIITVDPSLVIPDPSKTLEEGAVKPWTTKSFNECQQEMLAYAAVRGIRTNTPYKKLTAEEKRWVWEGGEDWTGNWRTQCTASIAFSNGSRARPTRCTSACCCHATVPTRSAPRAAAPT